MSAALQIYYTAFDAAFFKLPPGIRDRIQAKIDDLDRRLDTFPHHRLTSQIRNEAESWGQNYYLLCLASEAHDRLSFHCSKS